MDGEEDEMTRDEMRYLLRGGVVLYYFPFFLGKGERVLSCQYFHQEDSIEISHDDFFYSDLIFFAIRFFFSKKKQKTSCHYIPLRVDIQDR